MYIIHILMYQNNMPKDKNNKFVRKNVSTNILI